MSGDAKLPVWIAWPVILVAKSVLLFGRFVLKWNRLEKVRLIPLDTPLSRVLAIYGEPFDVQPTEDFPGSTTYCFSASPFHQAVISEIDAKSSCVTYWSAHASPKADLKCMLEKYGEGIGWNVIETGYLCCRKDGKVRLWCSIAPAIGVATEEYFAQKQAASAARS